MSTTNQGKRLQETIEAIAADYARRGIAKLHKVDPPCRIVGSGAGRRTIYLPNPFVDYVGTWSQRGGRTLAIEAKSTAKDVLPICQDNGITEKQWKALREWREHGAAVGVLWEYRESIRFVCFEAIAAQLGQSTKHVRWEHAREIPSGLGMCRFDFIKVVAIYYPMLERDQTVSLPNAC